MPGCPRVGLALGLALLSHVIYIRRVRLVTGPYRLSTTGVLVLHGPYRLATTGVFDQTPYEGYSRGVPDWLHAHTGCDQLVRRLQKNILDYFAVKAPIAIVNSRMSNVTNLTPGIDSPIRTYGRQHRLMAAGMVDATNPRDTREWRDSPAYIFDPERSQRFDHALGLGGHGVGLARHSRVSDWLHGPHRPSSTAACDHAP
jgi:hypothetical protein